VRWWKLARKYQMFVSADYVITMMQGLGGHPQRPGGYAEYVVVRASAVAVFAGNVDPLEMAVLGLASVTAFEALRKIGDIGNRRIAVTGRWGRFGGSPNSEGARRGSDRHHLLPLRTGRIRSFSRSFNNIQLPGCYSRRAGIGDD
jgi:hypothetical protein